VTTASGLLPGPDGRPRCWWAVSAPEYLAYHDDEWGRPVRDEDAVYERLCLEGFQSGLSWLTILRKREAFRRAFAGFDIEVVATFGDADVNRLLADAGIVRHRGKIEATVANARAAVAMRAAGESLAGLVWSFAPAAPARPAGHGDIPATTAHATPRARERNRPRVRQLLDPDLAADGVACGLVDDHVRGCCVPPTKATTA
jgi:DNA-3-methyladenine glycosylase I